MCRCSKPYQEDEEWVWDTAELFKGSIKACSLCSSGRLSQTVAGRSLISATAVAGLPPEPAGDAALLGLLAELRPLLG